MYFVSQSLSNALYSGDICQSILLCKHMPEKDTALLGVKVIFYASFMVPVTQQANDYVRVAFLHACKVIALYPCLHFYLKLLNIYNVQ